MEKQHFGFTITIAFLLGLLMLNGLIFLQIGSDADAAVIDAKTNQTATSILDSLSNEEDKLNTLDSLSGVCVETLEKAGQEIETGVVEQNNNITPPESKVEKKKSIHTPATSAHYITKLETIAFRGSSFDVCKVAVKKTGLSFFRQTKTGKRIGSFAALKASLKSEKQSLAFATNGGMFHASYEPVGLYVEEGKEQFPLNLADGTGNFFLKPNGVFCITNDQRVIIRESTAFQKVQNQAQYATQSGPMLVIDGKIHPKFNENSPNKRIRSGVGQMNSGKVVFVISNEPVTFYDFAMLFKKKYKCKNALYLDGVISEMYQAEKRPSNAGDFSVLIAVSQDLN